MYAYIYSRLLCVYKIVIKNICSHMLYQSVFRWFLCLLRGLLLISIAESTVQRMASNNGEIPLGTMATLE